VTDIIVQRCDADQPGDDIHEPLLSSVAAALARGRAELDRASRYPDFDSFWAHCRPGPSNGAGFRVVGLQKPSHTDSCENR